MKSDAKLFDSWRIMTSQLLGLNSWIPSKGTLKIWLARYKQNNINNNKKIIARRGKITEEVILCIITTIMDFPQWSGRQRMEYLNNKSGIFKKGDGISLRSVNRLISNLNFEIKTIKFTPPARNTTGLMCLRAFWASIVLEIVTQPNVIFMFIDEAAVTYLPNSIKGRALIGVIPVLDGVLSCKKLSILSCVVPGFGVIVGGIVRA